MLVMLLLDPMNISQGIFKNLQKPLSKLGSVAHKLSFWA